MQEDDADSFHENEEKALQRLAIKSRKKGKGKQKDKVCRKSHWPTEVVDDLVDIILESEKFKTNLLMTNGSTLIYI